MNIVKLHLNITNEETYHQAIDDILTMHREQTKPFSIIATYKTSYSANFVIRMQNAFRIWLSTRKSLWDKRIVILGGSEADRKFILWFGNLRIMRNYEIQFADNMEETIHLLETFHPAY